jgi:DNA-binding NarL/FixJ family response regulator
MISDPHPGVRWRLKHLIVRFGHEAVAIESSPTPAKLRSADVLLMEPASSGVSLARTARAANPSVAILCAGVAIPTCELTQLEPNLAGFVTKPLNPDQLDAAIQRALVQRDRLSAASAGSWHEGYRAASVASRHEWYRAVSAGSWHEQYRAA